VQIRAGNTALYIFLLSVAAVFLALAALYESWTLPMAVILVVPLCLLCSVLGVLYTHQDVDIFVQIGLVVLVGLACKNAILIVEFASQLRREGWDRSKATIEASRLRLRPILMTSFAFILGVVPLVIATGAGAEMRRSLGTAVFSGMLGVTAFGIFLTPVFFYVLQGIDESTWLADNIVHWVGSTVVGVLVGMVSGYMASELAGFAAIPTMAAGAAAGGVATLVLLEVHRRIKPGAPPKIIAHAGLPPRSDGEDRSSGGAQP
jgi:multidrug efflux pump